jgi:hypothetical protein
LDHPENRLDLAKLRAHIGEKPRTKAGQVRQAWPDIRQLIDAGHSLKDVWRWLNEIGVQIGYARLSDYVSRLRRIDAATIKPQEPGAHTPTPVVEPIDVHPLAHILERENKRAGFHYNAEPDPKKLI